MAYRYLNIDRLPLDFTKDYSLKISDGFEDAIRQLDNPKFQYDSGDRGILSPSLEYKAIAVGEKDVGEHRLSEQDAMITILNRNENVQGTLLTPFLHVD